ncbi:MAG TPA: acyl-homoserine-lactone synthase [Xanthobacteraceae bacterium]|nr:acyl-homoserine-lactone synthase [Xanthobacteraceae bacterium]
MIVVVEPHNARQYADLMDQMFRLRARVFRDRLKWDVQVEDGKERDKYDDEGPVYIIYADAASQKIKGSLRLLPTTGPTVLGDIFADTLPDAVALSAPTIWECTRFCVEESAPHRRHRDELISSGILIAALGEVAIKAGIEAILGNFDQTMLRLYRRIGCDVEVLGSTKRYGEPVYLGLFPVSRTILGKVKGRLRTERSDEAERPPLVA